MKDPLFPMRINKFLAHAGYTTRRSADTLIDAGRVFINGTPALIGQKVSESDTVEIKDHDTSHFRYILYYKPRGVITHSPGETEVDITTQIRKDFGMTGLFPVGRLDKDSEGLIILTNDGRVTDRILNPNHEHERTYEVTTDKRITETFLNGLRKGVNIEGYMTKPTRAENSEVGGTTFSITLTEGKKHQVRRMCAAMGYQVKRLVRTRMLNFTLKNLSSGKYHELKGSEIQRLYKELGIR